MECQFKRTLQCQEIKLMNKRMQGEARRGYGNVYIAHSCINNRRDHPPGVGRQYRGLQHAFIESWHSTLAMIQ